MNRVLLANVDYQRHMTNEGDQFQEGLRSAGWTLSGVGYDGLRDVPEILERHAPASVIVHDKRDWDPASNISFRKDIGFTNLSALAQWSGLKAVVVKDAATFQGYQRRFCEEVRPDRVIVYYHPQSVTCHAPWLGEYSLTRTYHSVDADNMEPFNRLRTREALVSGATGDCYPLRMRVMREARYFVDVLRHPGYGNKGARTADYLKTLAQYKVHVATASRFGFALRKIIESVAVGCVPITDLPSYDALPEIDGALVRVAPDISIRDLQRVVARSVKTWDADERAEWAAKARAYYDYRAIGPQLDAALSRVAVAA